METYKTHIHTPPHLFRPSAKYFITAAIYRRRHLLESDEAKERLLFSIQKAFKDHGWNLEDWVLLNNHYHLMADSPENAVTLSPIIQDVHKFTALWIKKNVPGAKAADPIWYNYWDTCITYEKSYFARLNYIWYNPVKHGYIQNAKEWKFGSYYYRCKEEKPYLDKLKSQYPFDNVKIEDDY